MVNITAPLRIGYMLFPAFTALDVFGPLNVLNLVSIKHNMTLSLISNDLSPVSIDRTIVNGVAGGMLASSASPNFTQFVLPTHTFATAPPLDVIIVPGGAGVRDVNGTRAHVDWLSSRFDDPGLAYMMTVCTGASLLARTGKIAGRNATTNKAAFNWVKSVEHAEDVNWIAKARWVVDGNVWTSSGVSAGTDMTLSWIEHLYGKNESESMRVQLEWNALNQTEDPFAAYYGLT
ncbi:class I glutamine amidotransferase-like protein [Annulohypoxylon maeteangense]|uniref:class I glutamine amidotransferase-like protein n=1 Tax=Annulohypoxylon maeteangense TaxID=1927788 RepID=UPI0020077F07|nr:class I glutamine amidotransferase-like protein [Annulohypoxylon maeteangense]KAI0881360.1 class I glutamine amidotransferase-like protein [Annulohypoxylon maeteangense]